MTVFLSLGINSVRVSSLIPIESRFMSLISIYFFLSMLYTFIALVWFIQAEHYRAKKYLPYYVLKVRDAWKFVFKLIIRTKNRVNHLDSEASLNIEESVRKLNAWIFILF